MSGSERLWQLLADRATAGLSAEEHAELRRLLAEHTEISGDELDLAAAAADLAWLREAGQGLPEMPPALQVRLRAQARAFVERQASPGAAPAAPAPTPVAAPRRGLVAAAGWLAAAAILLFFLFRPVPMVETPVPPPIGEQRQELLRSASDVIQIAWAPPEAPGFEGVTGDVVWSNSRQAGFLRLSGMPVNDPSRLQYQLWIVDPSRDQQPVDGGVFDITERGEVIIPVDAKLPIAQPTVFAITQEQPGGVVVSDGPLLVIAAVET